jgi:hypothetical protein
MIGREFKAGHREGHDRANKESPGFSGWGGLIEAGMLVRQGRSARREHPQLAPDEYQAPPRSQIARLANTLGYDLGYLCGGPPA